MRLFVIGTSAGGHQALKALFSSLPGDIKAAFLVAQHISSEIKPTFGRALNKLTDLHVKYAEEGEEIQEGTVYMPIPDHHLLVRNNGIHLSDGPLENGCRPAIDTLFRSAAVAYKNRAIGVLLSGYLNDGVAGLSAIQRSGGITVIQDPKDAEYADLPENALKALKPDYCVPIKEMGKIFQQIIAQPLCEEVEVPEDVKAEAKITASVKSNSDHINKIGEHVSLSCPACGGPLWKLKDDKVIRYRCHTGHSYTSEILLNNMHNELKRTLWVSLRMFEERLRLLKDMFNSFSNRGYGSLRPSYQKKIDDTEKHINRLRALIYRS